MREKILQLEKQASLIEPSADERHKIRQSIINYTESFLEQIEEENTYFPTEEKGGGILEFEVGKKTYPLEKVIESLSKSLDHDGINPASGGHLGYIPGGGIYTSSLADYWADITNRYAGVFYANPGAVRIENQLIRWMNEIIGYPETAHGNLAPGGSVANLIGIVTARESKGIKSRDIPNSVIYLSKQAHHCIDKAIRVAGLGEAHIRYVEMDEMFRIDPVSLEKQILQDKAEGLLPWLLVASAGSTDVGAIDPLEQLASIATKHGLWFHVDGAYGGFFVLTNEGKNKLKGIEKADSLVIDPHKGLFLPYGLGVCLVKEGKNMQKAFSYEASYLQDASSYNQEISPADVSPELTKHFRGLRMWLPLILHGIEPFAACLEEKLLLANYFYDRIKTFEGFEVTHRPELSVVTYRYVPDSGNANKFNEALLKEIHTDGRVFISSTTLNGIFTLRLAVLAFRTHLRTIDLALEILKEKSEYLERNRNLWE